jgi:hypothetical protein
MRMRILLTLTLLLGVSGSAVAQQTPDVRLKPDSTSASIAGSSGCWAVTSRDRVVVEMDAGPARTGTLLCMGPDEIMLTGGGVLPLSSIRRISKPKDGALDGMLKGAAVGLVILAFCAPDCPGEYVLRATLGYAVLGATLDSLQGNEKVIYRREPKVAMGFTLRF